MEIIKNEKELFEKALGIVLEFEGYKTEDTGGRTVYGISENAHPEAIEKMWKLPEAEAREIAKGIYYEEYWEKLFMVLKGEVLDALYETPEGQALAITLFDTAVNMGFGRAQSMLSEAINNGENLTEAKESILWERVEFYTNLAKSKKYSPYLRGWLNRVIQLRKKVLENG